MLNFSRPTVGRYSKCSALIGRALCWYYRPIQIGQWGIKNWLTWLTFLVDRHKIGPQVFWSRLATLLANLFYRPMTLWDRPIKSSNVSLLCVGWHDGDNAHAVYFLEWVSIHQSSALIKIAVFIMFKWLYIYIYIYSSTILEHDIGRIVAFVRFMKHINKL